MENNFKSITEKKGNNYTVKSVTQSQMVLPKLIEQKIEGENIILNGVNHKFVKFLLELYQKSATHKAMIDIKSTLTAGHSIQLNESDLSAEEVELLKSWMENINLEGEDLHDVISNLALDYWIFGYCFLSVGYNKLKEPNSMKYVDATCVAVGKTDNGIVKDFYFSNDWSNFRKKENTPVYLPGFNPESISKGSDQILMIRNKQPGLVYYSLPSYDETTMTYALVEFDLAKQHLNNTNSGFFPSAIITHLEPGLTEQQQDDVVESFEELYTGSNQKKIVHVFVDDKEQAPKVDSFPDKNDDEKFLELNRVCESKIAIGHKIVNRNLACIPNEGGTFSDRQNLQDSFELLLKFTIQPIQNLIEKNINRVIKLKVPAAKINIVTNSPLQFKAFSENILSQVLTQSEIRKELGKAPLKEGELSNLDTVRNQNPDLNNGQAVYPNSILEQDDANNENINPKS